MQRSGRRTHLSCCMEHMKCCVTNKSNKNFPQGKKGECCMPDGSTTGRGSPPVHTCPTKEIFSLCGDTFANIALRLPWTARQKNLSLHAGPPDSNVSLVELLVSDNRSLNIRNRSRLYPFVFWFYLGGNVSVRATSC